MDINNEKVTRVGLGAEGQTASPLANPEIGRRMAARRKMLHISQVDLALAIGVSQTAVSEYENGKRFISAKELSLATRKLGAPIDYFLGRISLDDLLEEEAHFAMFGEDTYELTLYEVELLEACRRLLPKDQARLVRVAKAFYDGDDEPEMTTLAEMFELGGG